MQLWQKLGAQFFLGPLGSVYSAHWWSSGNMLMINLRNIGIVPVCSWCFLLTVFVVALCVCMYIYRIYIFLLFTILLGLDDMGFLPDTNKDWLIPLRRQATALF